MSTEQPTVPPPGEGSVFVLTYVVAVSTVLVSIGFLVWEPDPTVRILSWIALAFTVTLLAVIVPLNIRRIRRNREGWRRWAAYEELNGDDAGAQEPTS